LTQANGIHIDTNFNHAHFLPAALASIRSLRLSAAPMIQKE
jgi:hypothetical protein